MEPEATKAWLQPVGTAEEPLDHDWMLASHGLIKNFWSTLTPESIGPGHLVVYYATGWHKAIAIVKVVGEARGGGGGRWQWRVPICPLVVLDMDSAIDLHDAEVESNRKYKELGAEEYERLRALMVSSVARLP